MAGEETAGIFYAGGAFAGGFEKVAHLSGDVAERGHGEQVRQWDGKPPVETVGDQESADEASDRAFPGFFGGDVGGKGMPADGAAYEVGRGVCGPGHAEGEQQETWTLLRNAVKANRKG